MKKIDIDKTPDEICFRPMLFSTPMVNSLLNRKKTQTRGIMNPQPFLYKEFSSKTGYREWYGLKGMNNTNPEKWIQFSNIKINDIIWVRETFSNGYIENGEHTGYKYKANDINYNVLWKPSLFMPKKACRLWLKITNIRVERLQDISEEDAINEGINSD